MNALGKVAVFAVAARHPLPVGDFHSSGKTEIPSLSPSRLLNLPCPVGFQQQRQMPRTRAAYPSIRNALSKVIVKRQGREPLFSAYHVRYLHQVVIHDVGQMIGRQPVSRFYRALCRPV